MATNTIVDRRRLRNNEWVRQSFMITHSVSDDNRPDSDEVILRTKFFTTARYKFQDTTLGGNIAINPHPQFTRSADIRAQSLYKGSAGMGRAYSEYIDDNKRIITMNFGVPQFNSLSSFFQNFYDAQASSLARTGRSTGVFYTIGRAIGFVVAISYIPLMFLSVGGALLRFALDKPSSRFFYFKPTMSVYWNAVSALVNDIAVKQGLVARAIGKNAYPTAIDYRDILSDTEMRELNEMNSDLLDSYDPSDPSTANGINMYAVATKAQRMATRAYKVMQDHYANNRPDTDDPSNRGQTGMNNAIDAIMGKVSDAVNDAARPSMSWTEYINTWVATGGKFSVAADKSNIVENSLKIGADEKGWDGDLLNEKLLDKGNPDTVSWTEYLVAELNDGAQYVSFRVEHGGSVQESFSSNVGESALASKINEMSGSARSVRNSAAQGNFSDGPIGTAVGAIVQAGANMLTGFADSLGLGGLAILGGNAFVDIPRNWESSTANLPRMQYTIKLRTPYGNRYSRMVNLYIPLAMLLAGSVPLSAGKQSYTSPFLCNLFDRGRAQTRLGIITNLSITRGTTNVAFNEIGEALGIDVTFTVEELSTVMHMAVSQGFGFMEGIRSFDDETAYHDYINTISALSLTEQIYTSERFKLAFTRMLKQADSFFSVPHATNFVGDLLVGRVGSMFYDGLINR